MTKKLQNLLKTTIFKEEILRCQALEAAIFIQSITPSFILEYLREKECFDSELYRAYKSRLRELATERGRKFAYRGGSYSSFERQLKRLEKAGLVMPTGREEPSDSPVFAHWPRPPMRRYYALCEGR